MKFRHSAAIVAALGALVLATSVAVIGEDRRHGHERDHDAIREALQRGEVLPLVKILAIASQHVAGDVIEVELEDEREALVYEIKILTSTGRVREVKIDARTGAVLKIEGD